jgi:hypothetical protein
MSQPGQALTRGGTSGVLPVQIGMRDLESRAAAGRVADQATGCAK